MYELLTVLQFVVLIAILMVIVDHYRGRRVTGLSLGRARERGRSQRALAEAPTRYEEGDRHAAEQERYRFLHLPGVEAGTVLHGVPSLNPQAAGSWSATREVVSLARVVAHPDDGGRILTDLLELGGGYLLVTAMGRAALLKHYPLSRTEERILEAQRRDALEKGDPVLEEFHGKRWQIRTACGKGRRGIQDTLQVLSLPRDGTASVFPPEVLDGREHAYFDLRAMSDEGDYLLAFWVEGNWHCFLGRCLEPQELAGLSAV